MSLLNKMLRDLDTRRAADSERQSLPGDVRPLPPAPRASAMPVVLGVFAGAAVLVGLFWWAPWMPSVPAPLVMPPPVASPPVSALPTSAPVPAPSVTAPSGAPRLKLEAELPAAKEGTRRDKAADTVQKVNGDAQTAKHEPATPKVQQMSSSGSVNKSLSSSSSQGQAESEYRRGQGLLAQGAGAEAEAAFRQALHIAPEHALARQALFVLMVDQQRKDEARVLLEEGLNILPGHSTWAMNVARLQMEKADANGAWETLQRSLPTAQDNGEYRAFCGTVLQRLGRSKEAIEHFNAALRINPAEGRWWLGLALVLEADNHPAEAREAYSRAKATGSLPADLAAFAEQKSRK
ncbi:MAG: tetratricopeptide repeat protein [Rhodocyclaceae bacterium]|nr:MAG: tetratricopeptide repeat protein [Rhodocyclaceae bacterium]